MAVEFAEGVVIGADSRTTTGYIVFRKCLNTTFFYNKAYALVNVNIYTPHPGHMWRLGII